MEKAKAIIIACPQNEENAQMFILNDDNSVLTEDSIPISKGVYEKVLTPNNFAYVEVEFTPNNKWDGIFETVGDYEKFDYVIEDIVIYNSDVKTVTDLMKEDTFWHDVKVLIESKEWEKDEVQ